MEPPRAYQGRNGPSGHGFFPPRPSHPDHSNQNPTRTRSDPATMHVRLRTGARLTPRAP